MYAKPNRDMKMTEQTETVAIDPTVYYTKPLETWSLRELYDALGCQAVAQVWGVTTNNARQVRFRGRATIERMQALQAAVRLDEQHYRNTLITLYSSDAFRRRA